MMQQSQNSAKNSGLRDLTQDVRVKAIFQDDSRTLGIQWTDGKEQRFDVVELRRACPCAHCIDEWTHEQILKPESIAETVRPVKVDSVGQYALTIQFNDGHRTGIYTFQFLRSFAQRSRVN